MRPLIAFNNVTIDGYFTSRTNDMSWAYAGGDDAEFAAFTRENASGNGSLVLGRVTYEMMAGFWPTDSAMQTMPDVARGMNAMEKILVSRSITAPSWQNTRVVSGDLVAEFRRLKEGDGPGMTILGSGSVVAQLAEAGLVDEYQLVVNPVLLGAGRTMFDGVTASQRLALVRSRVFGNGKTFLAYRKLSGG